MKQEQWDGIFSKINVILEKQAESRRLMQRLLYSLEKQMVEDYLASNKDVINYDDILYIICMMTQFDNVPFKFADLHKRHVINIIGTQKVFIDVMNRGLTHGIIDRFGADYFKLSKNFEENFKQYYTALKGSIECQ